MSSFLAMDVVQFPLSVFYLIILCVALVATQDQQGSVMIDQSLSQEGQESQDKQKYRSSISAQLTHTESLPPGNGISIENNNNGANTVLGTNNLPNRDSSVIGDDMDLGKIDNNFLGNENNKPASPDTVNHPNVNADNIGPVVNNGSIPENAYAVNSHSYSTVDKPVDLELQNNFKDFTPVDTPGLNQEHSNQGEVNINQEDDKADQNQDQVNEQHSEQTWKSYGEEKGSEGETGMPNKDDWYDDPTEQEKDDDDDLRGGVWYNDDNDPDDEDEEEGNGRLQDDDEDENYNFEEWIKNTKDKSDWTQNLEDVSQQRDFYNDDSGMIENVVDQELANKNKQPTAPSSMVLFYTWMIVALLIMVVGISTYQSRCKGLKIPGMKQSQGEDRKRLIDHEYV